MRYIKLGHMLGYSDCCIKHFAETKVPIHEKYHSSPFSGTGYVLCPKCLDKDVAEILTSIKQKRLFCLPPFPMYAGFDNDSSYYEVMNIYPSVFDLKFISFMIKMVSVYLSVPKKNITMITKDGYYDTIVTRAVNVENAEIIKRDLFLLSDEEFSNLVVKRFIQKWLIHNNVSLRIYHD